LVIVFFLAWLPASAQAQLRFIPNPQDTVLVLSNKATGQDAALRGAVARWREQPDNLNTSLEYARAAFLAGMAEGDLRWFGAAKTALNPWWTQTQLPAEAFFVRALVKQGFHDFDGALLDLQKAIEVDNTQLEFLGWQVAIYLVKAEMEKARQTCALIRQRFGTGEGDACTAQLQYRSGDTVGAIKTLDTLIAHPDFQGPNARDWLAFHRGEARRVNGDVADAIGIWRPHLQSFPRNHVLRLALVELLNQEKRFQEAWQLNTQAPRSDALLVQAIISSRGMGQASAQGLTAEFKQRLEFQRQRGDGLIERPHLVFLLQIDQQPAQALTLALESWQTQREPADAILLAQAAIGAGKPAAIRTVMDWQATTGYTEPTLQKLLAQAAAPTAARTEKAR
jgi:tetratricopeptide (TPR) repeat protein